VAPRVLPKKSRRFTTLVYGGRNEAFTGTPGAVFGARRKRHKQGVSPAPWRRWPRFTGLLAQIIAKNSSNARFSAVFFFTSGSLSRMIGLTGRVRNISASFCFMKSPGMGRAICEVLFGNQTKTIGD
jgi:hypothetical protein